MENMMKLGPKHTRGTKWDEGGKSEIVQILISYDDDIIKSIQFVYPENAGVPPFSQVYGEPTGSKFKSVVFDHPFEYLKSVSGVYGNGLSSITFRTNQRKYGPFGDDDSEVDLDFKYEFGDRDFGGFHGTVFNNSIDSIGVYVKPVHN